MSFLTAVCRRLCPCRVPSTPSSIRSIPPAKLPPPTTLQTAFITRRCTTALAASWTNLPDIPGYLENLAGGINNHGVVAGDPFVNSSFVGGVGYTWNGSSYSFFSAPGSDPTKLGTATYSINDAGQIVGYFQDSSGVTHGYLKTGSNFTTLDAPGASGTTSAQGINNLGVVTGYYLDAAGNANGYIWNNGQFTTLNVPFAGAIGTDITAINDHGDLTGWYLDADGNYHGFEAFSVPEPTTATLMLTGLAGMILRGAAWHEA